VTAKEKLIVDLDWLKDQLHWQANHAFHGDIHDRRFCDLSVRANEVAKLRNKIYLERD
jgi:hypothetical protein